MARIRVQSLDALERFRGDLLLFSERARGALDEASGEVNRTLWWLRYERLPHWQQQVRRLTAKVNEARGNLLGAKLTKSSQTQADERRALRLAEAELEHAERQVVVVRRLLPRFEEESQRLLAQCRKLGNDLDQTLPGAVQYLKQALATLEAYMESPAPGRRPDVPDEEAAP